MKKTIAFIASAALAVGAFASPAQITLTAPHITKWTQTISGFTVDANTTALNQLNSDLDDKFNDVQNALNTQFFNNINGLPNLAKGFANANMAAFDNASLLGYQTYDLFAGSVGFNLAAAVPTTNISAVESSLNDIINSGDVYAGIATGGFAGQFGLNLGVLIPNLYASAKLGFIPQTPVAGFSYQQGMFGIGANYTLLPQVDILFGFIKWRGVSVGSGFVFNGNSVTANVAVPDKSQNFSAAFDDGAGHSASISVDAVASKTSMTLNVKNSSLVIPIDLMTSLQALWFLNVGLGVGVDMAFSSAAITLDGKSDLNLTGVESIASTPGSVKLKAPDSTSGGDFFVPRVAASVGLNFAVFKIDFPVSYYPTTKAFAFGATGAIVW